METSEKKSTYKSIQSVGGVEFSKQGKLHWKRENISPNTEVFVFSSDPTFVDTTDSITLGDKVGCTFLKCKIECFARSIICHFAERTSRITF